MSDDYLRRTPRTEPSTTPATSSTGGRVTPRAASVPTTTPATTTPPTTVAPRRAAPVAAAPTGIWDSIAACETNGNWAANTGNGYYGGLQFLLSTWLRLGGGTYASSPNLASRDQQISVAERVVAAEGGSYRAWGACASHLGLS
jgi:hypothetical protein